MPCLFLRALGCRLETLFHFSWAAVPILIAVIAHQANNLHGTSVWEASFSGLPQFIREEKRTKELNSIFKNPLGRANNLQLGSWNICSSIELEMRPQHVRDAPRTPSFRIVFFSIFDVVVVVVVILVGHTSFCQPLKRLFSLDLVRH